MRQRVAFLRTLLSGKPVLALDEPFASLDAITRAEMQHWLAGALRADPRTVVLVTHDVEEALYLSDRVAVLSARPAPGRRGAERARAARAPIATRRSPRPSSSPPASGRCAPCDGGAERDEALAAAPALLLAALIGAWQIAAEHRRDRRGPQHRKLPRPLPGRNRRSRSGTTARCSPKTPG